MSPKLNLFYEEPDPDRWLPFDRFPRRLIRHLARGQPAIGGQQRVFLNLCAGLDRIGIAYRVNDYRHILRHPEEVACIIGKPFLLDAVPWRNPIVFGAAVFSHPLDDPTLLQRLPVKRILVPGEWMRRMFEPYYGSQVVAWPVGIDCDRWLPAQQEKKDVDILLYDKVRWRHDEFENTLIQPIRNELRNRGLRTADLRYGHYKEEQFEALLRRSQCMVFLCEHETQGIAYQQALSCGVPVFAWERGGDWQDPTYYPDRVRFGPVSSVPYWDDRCGMKFEDASDFPLLLEQFWCSVNDGRFRPRDYVLDNLTLASCARHYVEIFNSVTDHSISIA